MLFVLNRETGQPIFPVEERPVPASDVDGETASPTQPFTAITPPLSPHRFSADSVWALDEVDRAACRAAIDPGRAFAIVPGPIVTAGGLVFIGASLDRRLHAYDVETGAELWHADLPASAKATPMSYELRSGEQYVAVTVGGGDAWGTGDYVIAFRLP